MSVLWDKISALEAQLRQVEAERDELRNERDMAAARVMAFERGRCPGIPLDDGHYSGCGGGTDCPVCKGQRFDTRARADDLRAAVRAYFAVDGSEGTWSAVEAHAARERLRALLGGAS